MLQDLHYGARLLLRKRGFTAVVALTMALGIGANTAIFSVIDAVLLRPLPFRDPDRLVVLWEKNLPRHEDRDFVSPANFLDWKEQNGVFEQMAAVQNLPAVFAGGAADPEEVPAQRVSAALFPLLGIRPVLGRGFTAEEERPGHGAAVVLGYTVWQRRFGGDRSIMGKSVRISEHDWTVVGVMPPEFRVLNEPGELWIPMASRPATDERSRAARNLIVLARLRPGVELARAQSEMTAIARRLEQAWPRVNSGWTVTVMTLREELVGDVRLALLVVAAVAGLLLLMACANTGNLLLARATTREGEIAVRSALGAGRVRVLRQLLAESLLLAAAGGALGLLLAWGSVGLLSAFGPREIPGIAAARMDVRLLAFAAALSLLTAVLFGLAPALAACRTNLTGILNAKGRSGIHGRHAGWLRNVLVVGEVALAVVVLIGAGLMLEGFRRITAVQPGFDPHHVLTARIVLPPRPNFEQGRIAFFQQALERIHALPGVESASAVSTLPVAGLGTGVFFGIEGRPAPPAGEKPVALVRAIEPGYFRTMRIPLLAGRGFEPRDTRETPRVLIVNETLARRFWPGALSQALGNRITIEARTALPAEIVGLAGDVKAEGLNSALWPMIYAPHTQMATPSMTLVVRTSGDPLRLAPAVSREVHQMDANQPLADLRSMDQVLDNSLATRRFQAVLLAAFAGLALALATLGIYGLAACQVSERTREIGVRMALGAGRKDVLRMVLAHAGALALTGVGTGIAAALALTRIMKSLLFGIEPTDPWIYTAISLLLVAVAVTASYLPARRAARTDPMVALRYE